MSHSLSRLIGQLQPPEVQGVAFEDHGDRLVLRATHALTGIATKWFANPSVSVTIGPSTFTGPDVSMVGFAFTQFALPVRTGPGGTFDFAPGANLNSPPAVIPLLLSSSDGRVELLAPLGAWHEQIIAVDQTEQIDALRWGWHGDLDDVDEGFAAELGIFTGSSASEVFQQWGAAIRAAAGTQRPAADADPLLTHLSYWTDNGAAYWYRTEPDRDLQTTLVDKVAELDALGVPVRSVELDSWFYPHEISRPVTTVGYLEDVPPTGMSTWTPRPDVLPEGVDGLRRRLGPPAQQEGDDLERPLVLHSRHIAPTSPYLTSGEWWIDYAAHPVDPSFFHQWFDDAASWGATCIEQDWMMIVFFGTRQVRSAPGRALAWQKALDRAASDTGLTLLWCMPLPGDFAASVELSNVVAVRTSDDYRYADDPADLWVWYLTVNGLAHALGLSVFKDCFLSNPDPGETEIDGDPHAELEALLSAMSAGVVGIGDRIGRTDANIVSRLCRPDGLLVGPDRPITLTDRSFLIAGTDGNELCWASTTSGPWTYLVAINTAPSNNALSNDTEVPAPGPITDQISLAEVGIAADQQLVYNWRGQHAELASSITATLAPRDWALFVCCPVDADGEPSALIGDPSRYATMGRTRVDHSTGAVLLAEGEGPIDPLRWNQSRGLHRR